MTQPQSSDEAYMLRALDISRQARITAPPNPWVGCVLVKDGEIIGEGFTARPGGPHAEVNALNQAGHRATGATAYVTLEPCSHYGRTPPCALALIKARIARVVIGIEDPDQKVSGQGIRLLRDAGISVTTGLCKEAVGQCLAPYLHQRKTGLPYCVAKAAVSIDGRIAAKDGSSQWITGEEARRDAHLLRAESQAIMIGAGTAVNDSPRLTVRAIEPSPTTPPLRVLLDSSGRAAAHSPLFDQSLAPTLVVTTQRCPKATVEAWEKMGAEVLLVDCSANGRGVELGAVLRHLGARGIVQLLVEGGGTLLGSFIEANLLQHFSLYVGPCILGSGGLPLFGMDAIESIAAAPRLKLMSVKQLGDSLRADYNLHR